MPRLAPAHWRKSNRAMPKTPVLFYESLVPSRPTSCYFDALGFRCQTASLTRILPQNLRLFRLRAKLFFVEPTFRPAFVTQTPLHLGLSFESSNLSAIRICSFSYSLFVFFFVQFLSARPRKMVRL